MLDNLSENNPSTIARIAGIRIDSLVISNAFGVGAVDLDGINFVDLTFGGIRLIRIVPGRAVDDALAVRRPMRVNIVRFIVGYLACRPAVGIDDVDFVISSAVGDKRYLFSVRRPLWSDVVCITGGEAFLLTRLNVPGENAGLSGTT